MAKFKKGDRVRVVKEDSWFILGATGVVEQDSDDDVLVKAAQNYMYKRSGNIPLYIGNGKLELVEDEPFKWIDAEEFNAEMKRNGSALEFIGTTDPTVDKVIQELKDRSNKGMAKYGTTLSDNPLSLIEWLQHAKEEAMDNVLYLQRAIDELKANGND